jgi:hypothetical protein
LSEHIVQARQQAQEIVRRAERVAELERELRDIRKDRERFQKRHAAFAALGDRHVERKLESRDPGFGCELERREQREPRRGGFQPPGLTRCEAS